MLFPFWDFLKAPFIWAAGWLAERFRMQALHPAALQPEDGAHGPEFPTDSGGEEPEDPAAFGTMCLRQEHGVFDVDIAGEPEGFFLKRKSRRQAYYRNKTIRRGRPFDVAAFVEGGQVGWRYDIYFAANKGKGIQFTLTLPPEMMAVFVNLVQRTLPISAWPQEINVADCIATDLFDVAVESTDGVPTTLVVQFHEQGAQEAFDVFYDLSTLANTLRRSRREAFEYIFVDILPNLDQDPRMPGSAAEIGYKCPNKRMGSPQFRAAFSLWDLPATDDVFED